MPEIYSDQFYSVTRDLLVAAVAYTVYKLARDSADTRGRWGALWRGSGWAMGLALLAAVLMGQPSCALDGDPLRGGCEELAGEGYIPSMDRRAARFLYFALLLGVPVVAGVMNARQNALRPWRAPDRGSTKRNDR